MDLDRTTNPLSRQANADEPLPTMGGLDRRATVPMEPPDSMKARRLNAISQESRRDSWFTQEKIPSAAERDEYFKGRLKEHRDLMNSMTFDTEIEPDPFAWGYTNVTFKDLAFEVDLGKGNMKSIVEPCSGHLPVGSITAMMGPSGSGKTTLMDMIADTKTAKYSGDVYCNGRPRDAMFRRMTSYVGQEDLMPEYWTVQEAVLFNYRLKVEHPASFGEERQLLVVDALLHDLGLEKVKNTYIGGPTVRGCSGGQRRRVTLAKGAIGCSQVLFCDEPTSGLSATDAEVCIKCLRLLAKKYRMTIVVVIHQPRHSVALLFDKLILLTAEPGRMVFNGPMSDALPYFKRLGADVDVPFGEGMNPADYYLDLVTPGGPFCHNVPEPDGDATEEELDAWKAENETTRMAIVKVAVQAYLDQQAPAVEELVELKRNQQGMTSTEILEDRLNAMEIQHGERPPLRQGATAVSYKRQMWLLFKRQFILYVIRDQAGLVTRFVMAVMKALFIGSAYIDTASKSVQIQLGFLFMLLQTAAMAAFMQVGSFCVQRDIMKTETAEGLYTESAHIISNFLINTPLSALENTTFFLIMYALGQMPWDHFLDLYKWSLLLSITMDAFFGMAAAFSKNSDDTLKKAMPFLFLFLIYNGFMVTPDSAPPYFKWILYISPIAWSFEQIGIALYEDDPEWQLLEENYKWNTAEGHKIACIVVLLGSAMLFKTGEMLGLAYTHERAR